MLPLSSLGDQPPERKTIQIYSLEAYTKKLIEFVKFLQHKALNKRHIEYIKFEEEMKLLKVHFDQTLLVTEVVTLVRIQTLFVSIV